ncbi:MAG: FadR/GntR family transcriptional regulator [Desulfovibrio sp.]
MSITKSLQAIFTPVQIGRASEEIALQIEAAIMDGRLAPGEKLPSERDMQNQFGTGRGVIREAIKMLKQKGLLEVRKGAKGGAYIRQLEVSNVSESLAIFLKQHPTEPEKLIEFRETIDRTITGLAIARATQDEKEALLRKAENLEEILLAEEPDLEMSGELDRELNLMLAKMGRNPLFEWVMHALQLGFNSHDYALYEDEDFRKQAAANWKKTAKAITDNEPVQALSFISYHYVLLRECVKGKPQLAEPAADFLAETPKDEA